MPTLRWQLSLDDGASWQDIDPANGADLKLAFERDLDRGQIFFRRTLKGEVIFGGRDRKADYDLFWHCRRVAAKRCNTYLLRIDDLCANTWKTLWTGKFSRASGTFDHDRCTYTVAPKTVDRYTCLLESMDRKVNLLNVAPSTIKILLLPAGVEVLVNENGTWPPLPFPQPADFGWDLVDTQTVTRPTMGGTCPSPTSVAVDIYWRETVVTDCIGGVPVPPAGTGWIELDGTEPNVSDPITCGDEGRTKWARQPSIAWPWPNDPVHVGPSNGGGGAPILEPSSPTCSKWYRVGVLQCLGGFGAGLFLCMDEAVEQVTVERGRRLSESFEFVLQTVGCDVTELASDFLDHNATGDAFGYAPGINYVTAAVNEVDNLFILQKSDALDPTASNPATIGEATLAELLDLLRVTMQLFWDIDDQGRLRIEHWSYWEGAGSIDIRAYKHSEPLRFTYLDRETPRRERLLWTESLGRDFVGVDLLYDEACVGPDSDEALEHRAGQFMSDIAYVATDPDNLSKQGFVLLACRRTMSEFAVIVDFGALTGTMVTNAPLSTANLQDNYWRHNRLLPSGTMNDTPDVFLGFMPTAEQKDVTSALCCAIHTFDPAGEIITGLSELLTSDAVLEQAEYSIRSGVVTLTLRYAI